jgi:hypothetical protein
VYWLYYRLKNQGFDLGRGKGYLFLTTRQTCSVVHCSLYLIGTGFIPGGVQLPGREVDHSSPFGAEFEDY